jgi:hypothetical protein
MLSSSGVLGRKRGLGCDNLCPFVAPPLSALAGGAFVAPMGSARRIPARHLDGVGQVRSDPYPASDCSQWAGVADPERTLVVDPAGAGLSDFLHGAGRLPPGGLWDQFGGEPLQVHLVQRRHRVPRSTAIAAVTLDKSLELVANFAFLTGGIVLILQGQVFPGAVGGRVILLPLMLLALPLGFLLAIWTGRHPVSRLVGVGARFFAWQRWPGRTRWFAVYQEAYQAIRAGEEQATRFCHESPLTLVQALLVSMVSWVAIAAEYWLALHVLGLNPTPVQSISALTAARMAFLLPFPGGLGALEASQVLALGALGMNPAVGISLSLLIRVRDVMLGGLGLWWGGISRLGLK